MNGQNNPDVLAQFGAIEHYISTFGWALLQINSDGIIETVTESIKDLIRFTPADLLHKTIYSYLHPGDHAKLSPFLNAMSFQLNNWERQEDGQNGNSKRNIQKRIRMLVKHPESGSESMEQKNQHQEKYEEVVLYAATPYNKGITFHPPPFSDPKNDGNFERFFSIFSFHFFKSLMQIMAMIVHQFYA